MIAPSIVLFFCMVLLVFAAIMLRTVTRICSRIETILDREEELAKPKDGE